MPHILAIYGTGLYDFAKVIVALIGLSLNIWIFIVCFRAPKY